MASRKQNGDKMADCGLDEAPDTYQPLAKSDEGDLTTGDLERMCDAIEILANRAPTLTKAQLFTVQYKAGLAHRKLQKAIFEYVTRPRGDVNQGKLEKIHGDSMQDAGLSAGTKLVIPEVGTREKCMKTNRLDAFGDELKK